MHNLQRTNLRDLTFTGHGPSDLASQAYMINYFKATPKLKHYQALSGKTIYIHTYIFYLLLQARVWQLIKSWCEPATKINKLKIFWKIGKSKIVYSWHSLIQTLKRNQNLFKYGNVRGIGQCFLLPLKFIMRCSCSWMRQWLHIDCKSFAGFICCSRPKKLYNASVNSTCYHRTDDPRPGHLT